MGMVTARDLAESPAVSEIILGDVDIKKAEHVAKWIRSKKVSVKKIGDKASLLKAMREADAVANATPYHLNFEMTKTAMEAKKDLTDLGGVYHMTLKQLELNDTAEKAGVTIAIGCGLAPGIADVLAKYGTDKLDHVEEVHIRYGEVNLTPAKYKWTFRTVLEEYTSGPVIYEKGKFRQLSPFSGKHVVKFPDPIGERPCCYALYSGIATLPSTIKKGVKIVDCAMTYTEEDEQRIKVLNEMNLTKTEPIPIDGMKISPKEFLLRVAPPPDVNAKDVAGIVVEVTGAKEGESVKCVYSLVYQYNKEYNVSALAYLTGVPLSIVSQMLAKGDIEQKGVLPPETAIKPKALITELSKRGINISETIQRTCKL
jgi:saccharopine dehydrogenase-like NADP-dependent oxidoreductase